MIEALPFDDPYELDVDEPIVSFEDLQAAAPAPFKLPDDVLSLFTEAGQDISRAKWLVVRTMQACLAQMTPQQQEAHRADVIAQTAGAVGVDVIAVREWLHTGEVIPPIVAEWHVFGLCSFSHFARAARIGDSILAANVLAIAQRRKDEVAPGRAPTCPEIDQVVSEVRQMQRGCTADQIAGQQQAKQDSSAFRFTGLVVKLDSLPAAAVFVPPGKQINPGDYVIVIRQKERED